MRRANSDLGPETAVPRGSSAAALGFFFFSLETLSLGFVL